VRSRVHFIEVKTYRRRATPSTTTSTTCPRKSSTVGQRDDPVDRYVKQLVQGGWAEERELKAIDDGVKIEIDQRPTACIDEPLPAGKPRWGVCTPTQRPHQTLVPSL